MRPMTVVETLIHLEAVTPDPFLVGLGTGSRPGSRAGRAATTRITERVALSRLDTEGRRPRPPAWGDHEAR